MRDVVLPPDRNVPVLDSVFRSDSENSFPWVEVQRSCVAAHTFALA